MDEEPEPGLRKPLPDRVLGDVTLGARLRHADQRVLSLGGIVALRPDRAGKGDQENHRRHAVQHRKAPVNPEETKSLLQSPPLSKGEGTGGRFLSKQTLSLVP